MNLTSLALRIFCLCYFWLTVVQCAKSKHLIKINDENWRDILEGEWMINFFSKATWCPACKEMVRPWNAFADWSDLKKKKVKVAQVDVSENPGLSGRFLVTALPTIYHVKDGVFRIYAGPKDKEDFVKFIKDKQWSTIEPTSSFWNPTSFHMSLVASLFKFSMQAKDFHNHLVDDKGFPSLLSFGLFGTATLVLGCILGFIMVLIIDQFVPKSSKPPKSGAQAKSKDKKGTVNANAKVSQAQESSTLKNGNVSNGSAKTADQNRSSKTDKATTNTNSPNQATVKSDKKRD